MGSHIMKSVLSAALLIQAAYSHMLLQSPVPYGDPTNSPLDPSGSNFPCQGVSYTVKEMNNWAVGNTEKLSFKGSAVHGGGSCQIVVTTDKEPTKDSKWKVIHSIEGGCPGANGPEEIPFTIPPELPNGEMTAAWTWFNRIGNREMYMNCAPVTISGGSDDKAGFEGLPDMALANIAVGEGSTCKTQEMSDYTFENPGKYTTRKGSGPFVPLCGGAPASGQPAPGGAPPAPEKPASSAPASPSPTPSPPSSQAPAPTPSASDPPAKSSAPGQATSTTRVLVTITATGPSPSQPAAAPTSQSLLASGTPPISKPTDSPTAPGGGGNGACTTDGELVCNGESQFGFCDHGKVVWRPVADGTKCSAGAIVKRGYTHRAQRTAYTTW
jgi:hypothetical protein